MAGNPKNGTGDERARTGLRASFFCLLLLLPSLLLPPLHIVSEDQALSDSELAEMLYATEQEEGTAADFLVLPDDFSEPVTGLDGVFNLLLIGVDTDRAGITGRSDTMTLAVLNTRDKTVRLVSFLRDLYVRIPGKGYNRLNAAYAYGGPDLLVKTIRENFGVFIEGYLAVDFSLMVNLVDAIGGIGISVSPEERKALNGILEYYNYLRGDDERQGRLESAGFVNLTGLQAMSYARIRKIDSDFGRVERQQKTLAAIYSKLQSMDNRLIVGIIFRFAGCVKTDITLAEAVELAMNAFDAAGYKVLALSVPVANSSRNIVKDKVYYLMPNLKKNVEAIRLFLGGAAD